MSRLFILVAVFLASPAAAQVASVEARTCEPRGAKVERADEARDLREEADRLRGDAQNVVRQRDRLVLKLEGGKTVELADCPYGNGAYGYLYERFDEAGPLYVVRKSASEDFSYTLVMRRGGRLYEVYGTPIWAADKSRFATVACSLSPPRASLTIAKPAGEGLTTEAEFPLPCETESCSVRWDFQSWASVACAPRDGSGKKGTEFVLMRGNDGTWRKFGR
jgi:hypothetical protein